MRKNRGAQINDLHLPISIGLNHNVLRFQISMYHMQLMQLTNSLKQLSRDDLQISKVPKKLLRTLVCVE
jgi:hypothetical protein